MKRFLPILIMILGMATAVSAQQKKPKIVFDQKIHNFGTIREDGGKVTHSFTFVNQGGEPLIINRVKANCGCTTPAWTREPVKPGGKGFVRATFDPRRRPGTFNKSVVVHTNASKGKVLLRIQGKVQRRERTIEEKYPRKMGSLRLKSHHLAFARIKHTRVQRDSLGIVNVSGQPIRISFERVPQHIDLSTRPEVLQPGQKGHIHGTYDPTRINDWGFRMDRVRIKVNAQNVPHNHLVVSAKIMEDFSGLTARERKNAPHVSFENTSHDFGKVEKGGRVEHVFRFTNTGQRPLKIRKIRATCGCTTVKPEKTVIPSGETSSFKAILSVGSRKGQLHKSIYFISNDP
ncbi:MAG: DUF1573 domain-containing protein, partial [Bacteroidales bacterium]|nr:DUF1573 domain-containing protein [Bacteroidales bacterium]